MRHEILIAGHGGQGVVELANNISYHHLLKGRQVAVTPSYGPESRGGKVKCYMVVSDQPIDSPVVERPDLLIVMNSPSMDFLPLLAAGGVLLVNSSMVAAVPSRADIRTVKVPATGIAERLAGFGAAIDPKIAANSVILGAYLSITGEKLDLVLAKQVFDRFLSGRKSVYVPLNLSALDRGFSFAKSLEATPSL